MTIMGDRSATPPPGEDFVDWGDVYERSPSPPPSNTAAVLSSTPTAVPATTATPQPSAFTESDYSSPAVASTGPSTIPGLSMLAAGSEIPSPRIPAPVNTASATFNHQATVTAQSPIVAPATFTVPPAQTTSDQTSVRDVEFDSTSPTPGIPPPQSAFVPNTASPSTTLVSQAYISALTFPFETERHTSLGYNLSH